MLALSEANDDRRLEAQLRNARTVAGMRSSGSGTDYTSSRERSRLKEQILKDPFSFPSLVDKNGQLDPGKVNDYLDEMVMESEPPTQEEAVAEYKRTLKSRPDLESVLLTRLKNRGYNVEGL